MPDYVMGSGERLEISVDVKNGGEDAFSSVFFFQVTLDLDSGWSMYLIQV